MKQSTFSPPALRRLKSFLENHRLGATITFFALGIASTVWFLIRVIPKPSRATYPCMRATAPFMSGFVIYLIGLGASAFALRKTRNYFKNARYAGALGFAVVAFVGLALTTLDVANVSWGSGPTEPVTVPFDQELNAPVGTPKGIFPGRVVWVWDQDATNANCTNLYDNDASPGDDGYFLNKNNDQAVIDQMMSDVIQKMTGKTTNNDAWGALFKYFNKTKRGTTNGYQTTETVFIKVNQGTADWAANQNTLEVQEATWAYGHSETSPQVILAVIKQLVAAGVPQNKIIVADPKSHLFQHTYTILHDAYPNVIYGDKFVWGSNDSPKNYSGLGRTQLTKTTNQVMKFSDKGAQLDQSIDEYYTEMINATYMINIAALKGHNRAGITLCTKNLFGAHTRASAGHMHPGLIWLEGETGDKEWRNQFGMYRVLVDLMGHSKLGGNTMLFLVDGLWGGPEATDRPVKWQTAPFNNDWPNSLFASQDPVALESACYDFLRHEFTPANHPDGSEHTYDATAETYFSWPQYGAVDDYLHQAASNEFWPDTLDDGSAFAGYDPEGDGSYIGSLGVHEHWNGPTTRQYSRNLYSGKGIELLSVPADLAPHKVRQIGKVTTAPTFDGQGTDACWTDLAWNSMNYTWIPYDSEPAESDFKGRFKAAWSESNNLLYFLVEVTDDDFVAGFAGPNTTPGYPDYDIVEIFIDENNGREPHIKDGTGTIVWGYPATNAENAFSYHFAPKTKPVDGTPASTFYLMDLWGTSADASPKQIDYASHAPNFIVKKTGASTYTWEFSLKVYNDTYDPEIGGEAARVTLDDLKEMGLAVAYCDADGGTGREHFIGTDIGPQSWDNSKSYWQYNDHWANSMFFGTWQLAEANSKPVVSGSIATQSLTFTESSKQVSTNVSGLFSDPDSDPLTISVESDNANLTATYNSGTNTLTISAPVEYQGTATVTVTASDEIGEVSLTFTVNINTLSAISDPAWANHALRCYPNPGNGMVNLAFADDYMGACTLRVYALSGQMVHSSGLSKGAHRFEQQLDLSHLRSGMYFIEVSRGSTRETVMYQKF